MDSKKHPPNRSECANCTVPGDQPGITLRSCSRCKLVRYCGTECQTQHWKASHKLFCVAVDKRKPQPQVQEETVGPKCTICLGVISDRNSVRLPCSHTFHRHCIDGVRDNSAAQVCPLCRADLQVVAGTRIPNWESDTSNTTQKDANVCLKFLFISIHLVVVIGALNM
jgi:hypothetical protein